MSFPTKAERELCWSARDSLWQCLDLNKEQTETCLKQRKEYEKNCSAQWVKHFDRKRKYDKFKMLMEKGDWHDPLDKK